MNKIVKIYYLDGRRDVMYCRTQAQAEAKKRFILEANNPEIERVVISNNTSWY